MSLTPDIVIAGLLTVGIFTFLWRDNRVFRAIEHLYIGVTAAQALVIGVGNVNRLAVNPILTGNIIYIISFIAGAMIYFNFSKRYSYLARYPVALLVGVMAGLTIRGQTAGIIYGQSAATAQLTLIAKDLLTSANNIITVTGVIAALSYFIFARKAAGHVKYLSAYGKYVIMSALGSAFGAAVLVRNALLGGRMLFLLQTDFIYLLPIIMVLFAIWVLYDKRRAQKQQ